MPPPAALEASGCCSRPRLTRAIDKIWIDRTPYSLRAALDHSMAADLWDAVIPGFVLHWDLDDLVKAMGKRQVMWTDPTNWLRQVVALGPRYQYRYVLGDTTDLAQAQDDAYIKELLNKSESRRSFFYGATLGRSGAIGRFLP